MAPTGTSWSLPGPTCTRARPASTTRCPPRTVSPHRGSCRGRSIVADDFRISEYGSISRSCGTRPGGRRMTRSASRSRTGSRSREGRRAPLFSMMGSNELDLVFDADAPPELIETYQEDPALRHLIQTPVGARGLSFATFNVARPPFDDVAVREAVAYAMDRIRLAQLAAGPQTRVANHFGLDTFEASLLAPWAGFPGDGGHGDRSAAHAAMESSRYAADDRCARRGVPRRTHPRALGHGAGARGVSATRSSTSGSPSISGCTRSRSSSASTPRRHRRCASGSVGSPTSRAPRSTWGRCSRARAGRR